MLTVLKCAIALVFGSKSTTPSTAIGPRTPTQKASLGGPDLMLETRENPAPAAGLYVGFGSVIDLDGNLVQAQSQIAPGLGVEVDPILGAEKAFVSLNHHGLSLHLQGKDSPITVEVGTYGVDGFDFALATLVVQSGGPNGKLHPNDKVLLPEALGGPAEFFYGIDPNAPVNQPPGPYGNGAPPVTNP